MNQNFTRRQPGMSTHNNQRGGRPASQDDTPPPQLTLRVQRLITQIEILPTPEHDSLLQELGVCCRRCTIVTEGYAASAAAGSTAPSSAKRPPVLPEPTPGTKTPVHPLSRRSNREAPSTAARATSSLLLKLDNPNDSDASDDEDVEQASASRKRKANPRAPDERKKKASRKETSGAKYNPPSTRSGTRRYSSSDTEGGKSARERRLEKRNSSPADDGGGGVNEDEGAVPKRVPGSSLKVIHHGTHDDTKLYTDDPRTKGIYVILFEKTDGTCVVAIGISVANSLGFFSQGMTGRIKRAHGKLLQGESGGQVTTITGALDATGGISYSQLELFSLFYFRSLLPKERKCIHTTESFEVDSVTEGKRVLAKLVSICKEANQTQHTMVIDDRYNNPTECKITLLERDANPESNIVYFKHHDSYPDWWNLRRGMTEDKFAELHEHNCIMEPEKWQAATTWYQKLEFCVQFKKRSKCGFPQGGKWGVWLSKQRLKLREGNGLDDNQKKALREAGVCVNGYDHMKDLSRQSKEAGLASLAAYQRKHGDGSFPTPSSKQSPEDTKLGSKIVKWTTKFYLNQLTQEFVEELHGTYDLEVFDPNKVQKIQEVNGLTRAELRRRCRSARLPLTKKNVKVCDASNEVLVVRLLRHIFQPETYSITKVMTADEIVSTDCCGGNYDECPNNNNACATWTSDRDTSTTLDCCIDCGGDWDGDLPIEVLRKDLREVMLANCTNDKEAAKDKLSIVPEFIEHEYCVCGETHDGKKDKPFWLQCNECKDWYYVLGSCDGVPFATQAEAEKSGDEEKWYCSEKCTPSDSAHVAAEALLDLAAIE